jgi:hypothetical protein
MVPGYLIGCLLARWKKVEKIQYSSPAALRHAPVQKEPEPARTPRQQVTADREATASTGLSPSQQMGALEEYLLQLCRGDRRMFEDLLAYERSRHAEWGRAELLELAIEHFTRDNR